MSPEVWIDHFTTLGSSSHYTTFLFDGDAGVDNNHNLLASG